MQIFRSGDGRKVLHFDDYKGLFHQSRNGISKKFCSSPEPVIRLCKNKAVSCKPKTGSSFRLKVKSGAVE